MKQEEINKLLEKYYSGETNLEEEAKLKEAVESNPDDCRDEQLAFGFYQQENTVPEGLEDQLFKGIQDQEHRTRFLRNRWLKYSSAVAAVALAVSIFWFSHQSPNQVKLTKDEQFAIMEKALMQVSNGLQPQDDKDMLVLYQDDQLEIVAN
ncbi:MAG TPA: hypothetical protein VKA27_05565 [Sunxiuqinia sp.]|nr:hypothetical protein [Sunxiuqinia sp.]